MTSKEAPGAMPPEAVPSISASSANPLSISQDLDTLTLHNFDVTMADSTFTFGNTMRMDDLGGRL